MVDVHMDVDDRDSQGGPLNGWFTEGAAYAAPFLYLSGFIPRLKNSVYARRRSRSKNTNSNDTAAGVTPEMRAA